MKNINLDPEAVDCLDMGFGLDEGCLRECRVVTIFHWFNSVKDSVAAGLGISVGEVIIVPAVGGRASFLYPAGAIVASIDGSCS